MSEAPASVAVSREASDELPGIGEADRLGQARRRSSTRRGENGAHADVVIDLDPATGLPRAGAGPAPHRESGIAFGTDLERCAGRDLCRAGRGAIEVAREDVAVSFDGYRHGPESAPFRRSGVVSAIDARLSVTGR